MELYGNVRIPYSFQSVSMPTAEWMAWPLFLRWLWEIENIQCEFIGTHLRT